MINPWLKKTITRLINNETVVSCCPNSCIMLNLSTVKNSCNSLVSSKSELEFWGFLELRHWQWRRGWLFWTHGTFTGGFIFINAKVFLQNDAVSVFYEAKKKKSHCSLMTFTIGCHVCTKFSTYCIFLECVSVSAFMFLNVGEIYSRKQILMKLHKITEMEH